MTGLHDTHHPASVTSVSAKPEATGLLERSAAPTVTLFGDSLLARFTKPRIDALERQIGHGATVYNCAAGGWTSDDCAVRAAVTGRQRPDVLVLSLGMNDSAPWNDVPLDRFGRNVRTLLGRFPGAHVVGFLPPRVVEKERPGRGPRDNATLARYRTVLRETVGEASCLETDELLDRAGIDPHEPDGVHLTDAAYDVLVRPLAALVAAESRGTGTSGTRP